MQKNVTTKSAKFLQLHILQKVLHFRPREESVITLNSGTSNSRKIPGPKNANWEGVLHEDSVKDLIKNIY